MLQAARSAKNLLREAGDNVVEFLRGRFNEDGGARGRSRESDLYYTVFALDGLAALGVRPPAEATQAYLRRFGEGAELDFVHRACLARCRAALADDFGGEGTAAGLLRRIESCRSCDGGYAASPGSETGTVYNCFLALGAYQDLSGALPRIEAISECLARLRTPDGAYANETGLQCGTTPTTAAATVLMLELGLDVPEETGHWLLERALARGGFLAVPQAPIPDLLSTATALHALSMLGIQLDEIREPNLDFLDTLWTGRAFCGSSVDQVEDCEYTFYGLLALGYLSGEVNHRGTEA